MEPLKICMLSSEMLPYAKTGGLADVAGALFGELAGLGHDIHAFMPLYASIRAGGRSFTPIEEVQAVTIVIGAERIEFSLFGSPFPGAKRPVFFIDCPKLFDRASLYTTDPDEHLRFLFFTRAAIESCRLMGFVPDVFHCNDWHTAFLPLLLKTLYSADPALARVRSVLTIHNIGYQGLMPASAAADLGLGSGYALLDQDDLRNGVINSLKTGIRFADKVTTVSPTYAREICTVPLGMGMEAALRARADGVTGILNGVDYAAWDPRHDPHLSAHFDPHDLTGKRLNKRRLLTESGLVLDEASPLLSIVSRLTDQKGFDLLFDALPESLAARDCGLTVLGSGDQRYVTFSRNSPRGSPGAWHSAPATTRILLI